MPNLHKCPHCDMAFTVKANLDNHIIDSHFTLTERPGYRAADVQVVGSITGRLPSKNPATANPPRSNNPPHTILELEAREVRWLNDTLAMQATAGLEVLGKLNATEGAPDRRAAETLVEQIELVRGIMKKLKGDR